MEYSLLLEKKKRVKIFWGLLIFAFIFLLVSFKIIGLFGLFAFIAALLSIIISPLLHGRDKFFLYSWLICIPLFDFLRFLSVGGATVISFAFMIISMPYAIILVFNRYSEVSKKFPFIHFLMLFQIALTLSFIFNMTSIFDVREVFKYFIQIFIIFLTFSVLEKEPEEDKNIFKWINLFIVLNSLVGIVQKLTGIGLIYADGVYRITGLIGSTNGLGFLINIHLILTFYMFINAKSKKEKELIILSILISVLALILTLSKTSYLIFIVTLFGLFLMLPSKAQIKLFVSSLFATIILIIINYAFNLNFIESIIHRFNDNNSFEWRVKIWNYLLYKINSLTFFIGNGFNSSTNYLLNINPGDSPYAHNLYLELFYEYGVWGLFYCFSYILIGFNILIKALKTSFKDTTLGFILLIILSVIIDMYSSNSMTLRTPLIVLWTMIITFLVKVDKIK